MNDDRPVAPAGGSQERDNETLARCVTDKKRTDAARRLELHLRFERAVAGCSRALLLDPDETALDTALSELLHATDADYVYVDENYIDPEQGLSYRIVHEASAPLSRSEAGQWMAGPYSESPTILAALTAGSPVAILVRELDEAERDKYEREGMLSELCLPIYVDGAWAGSIGFSDYLVERRWTDNEIRLLQVAAEMVGAFWQRRRDLRRLEELIRSKDEFLASVSHELRTPLTTAVGFTDLLLNQGAARLTAEDRAEMLALAHRAATEAAWIIDDLLVYARGDIGTLAVAPVPVDLGKLVPDEIAAWFRDEHDRISTSTLPVIVRADAGRISQIVRNLLQNALRYGGPNVDVTVRSDLESGLIEVSDDGPGIPPEAQEAIFHPYGRAHQEPSQPGSVGLGLTISRGLAQLMGGSLEYTHDGSRTTFTLAVPLARRPPTTDS